MNEKIHLTLVDSENYSNTAGIVLTGMFVSFFVLICDLVAVYRATSGKHEYDEDHVTLSLNTLMMWVILGLDLIAVGIIPTIVLSYIFFAHLQEDKKCIFDCCKEDKKGCGYCTKENFFPFIFMAYVHVVFGDQKHFWGKKITSNTSSSSNNSNAADTNRGNNTNGTDEANKTAEAKEANKTADAKDTNARMLWVVAYAAIAPLFTIPSHIIFILAAWLTDPSQASSIALVAIGVFLYFFLLFRQCYKINRLNAAAGHCAYNSTRFGLLLCIFFYVVRKFALLLCILY